MTSTYSPNLHLELMGTGDQPGTWGAEMNNAVFTILDNVLGATLNLPMTNASVTLTTLQTQNNLINITGTLTANVNLIFPNIGRHILIRNATSGNFSITVKCVSAGTTVVARQGFTQLFVISSPNVYSDALTYTPVHQGGGSGQGVNQVYIGWLGSSTLGLQIDASNFGNTWPINITGNAGTAGSVGGVSNPTAKNTLIAYQSGIAEFGGVLTDGTAQTVDLPSPWVQTGLRAGPAYAGGVATLYPRARALMTQ